MFIYTFLELFLYLVSNGKDLQLIINIAYENLSSLLNIIHGYKNSLLINRKGYKLSHTVAHLR